MTWHGHAPQDCCWGTWPRFAKKPMPFRREQAKVFLDRRCLLDGQNWIEGFVQGVTSSMVSTQKLSKSRRHHGDTPGLPGASLLACEAGGSYPRVRRLRY